MRRAKEHIVAGDVIQVVLSQQFTGQAVGEDLTLYRNLRSVNPSPYMFYLNFDDIKLIGASPEKDGSWIRPHSSPGPLLSWSAVTTSYRSRKAKR